MSLTLEPHKVACLIAAIALSLLSFLAALLSQSLEFCPQISQIFTFSLGFPEFIDAGDSIFFLMADIFHSHYQILLPCFHFNIA